MADAVDGGEVEHVAGGRFALFHGVAKIHQRFRQRGVASDRGAAAGAVRIDRADQVPRLDQRHVNAQRRQFLVEGGRRQDALRVAAGLEECVAVFVACKRKEQRCDHRIDGWFVVEPLEDAVLAHRLARIERGHMCAGGGRELRREARGAAVDRGKRRSRG
jgi:hypothetical protein